MSLTSDKTVVKAISGMFRQPGILTQGTKSQLLEQLVCHKFETFDSILDGRTQACSDREKRVRKSGKINKNSTL